MFKTLQKFFSNDEPSPTPTPLGLTIGGSWRTDLFSLRANAAQYQFKVIEDGSTIVAHGQADLGDGVALHRFYDTDEQMLQILSEKNDPQAIQEITLFQSFDSIQPNTTNGWQEWTGPQGWMRLPTYELDDGTIYQRTWFTDDPGAVEPVQFTEFISRERNQPADEQIEQHSMLYSRSIPDSPPEHLLVIKETNADGSSIELMVGVDLSPTELTVL
jgi:hypothetical protein